MKQHCTIACDCIIKRPRTSDFFQGYQNISDHTHVKKVGHKSEFFLAFLMNCHFGSFYTLSLHPSFWRPEKSKFWENKEKNLEIPMIYVYDMCMMVCIWYYVYDMILIVWHVLINLCLFTPHPHPHPLKTKIKKQNFEKNAKKKWLKLKFWKNKK